MFSSPILYLKINSFEEFIDPLFIYDYKITYSLKDFYPKAEISIQDKDGTIFSEMKLVIGSHVTLIFNDYTNPNISVEIPDFVISKISNGFEHSVNNKIGIIKYDLVHKWALNKDYTLRAFPPMPMSDIVKNVLMEGNRTFNFSLEESFIKESDEGNKIPRYKLESDIDFLKNKILPFCTINKTPAKLFIDCNNKIHLDSYYNLFNKEPSNYIAPPQTVEDNIEDILKELEALKLESKYVYMDDAFIKIGMDGADKFYDVLLPRFYFFDHQSYKTIVGKRRPYNPLSDMGKDTSKLPIDLEDMKFITKTSLYKEENTTIENQISKSATITEGFFDMFEIIVQTIFSPGIINIGDTIFLGNTKITNETGTKNHWISGKYLITEVVHQKDNETNIVKTFFKIIKPSFSFEEKDTSLFLPQRLFS